jgi:hypothetical protein
VSDEAFEAAWIKHVDGADSTDGAMAFKSECRKIWDAGVKFGEDHIRELFNRPYEPNRFGLCSRCGKPLLHGHLSACSQSDALPEQP